MDYISATGILGALVLVTGAAWPEKKAKRSYQSIKNWLLAIGGVVMLTYATLGYLSGGPIFFVFLQALVIVASIMMMLDLPDKIDIPVISITGIGLIIWSIYLFQGYNTVFFILGLTGVGLGYTLEMRTVRRSLALMLGGILIAIFSYMEASWIFFWLNTFFAIFSGYYVIKGLLNLAAKRSK